MMSRRRRKKIVIETIMMSDLICQVQRNLLHQVSDLLSNFVFDGERLSDDVSLRCYMTKS